MSLLQQVFFLHFSVFYLLLAGFLFPVIYAYHRKEKEKIILKFDRGKGTGRRWLGRGEDLCAAVGKGIYQHGAGALTGAIGYDHQFAGKFSPEGNFLFSGFPL